MPTFISFDEFAGVLSGGKGLLVFVLTSHCDDDALEMGERIFREIGSPASVNLLCAAVDRDPTLVYYRGGDTSPLLTRDGPEAPGTVATDSAEAIQLLRGRERAEQDAISETEKMLESEQLDRFPPFFQMARNLARDAWFAARSTAAGAPLLLSSEAAAARLEVCSGCASLRGERCIECGCHMTIKAHIAAMQCPLGKWPAEGVSTDRTKR